MRFLVDAQLPPGLARWLAAAGYPSDHVNDLGHGAATDDDIEARARETQAVVWSKDRDFADRARRRPGQQVVWVRFGNTTKTSLRTKLAPHLPAIEAALSDGESLIEIR